MHRPGVGSLRSLEVKTLWLQDKVKQKDISVHKVGTKLQLADVGTKYLSSEVMTKLMALIGARRFGSDLQLRDF